MILNLTQHLGTPEQGVTEPRDKAAVQRLLTVETLPSKEEISKRCLALALLAASELEMASAERSEWSAMIGGAPWLMAPLERALRAVGIEPVYAFSVRESVDQKQPDGSVRKVAVFRHVGFVPAVKG